MTVPQTAAANSTDAPRLPPVRRPAKRPREAESSPPPVPPPVAPVAAPTTDQRAAPTSEPLPLGIDVRTTPAPWWRRIRQAPSWLLSGVLHLVLLLVLAWWTVSQREQKPPVLSIIGSEAAAIEPLEDANQWVQEVESSSEVRIAAPDMASLGPMDDGAPILDSAVGGDSVALDSLTGSSLSQIGALFVPGGGAMSSGNAALIKKEAMFFGVKATGNRFVFIVDSSNSMRGNKFADAKRELIYAIRRLSKEQYFYVIFFDADAERMVLDTGPNAEPAPRPVPATSENMMKVERWIESVQNELKTNPFEAVEFAMGLYPDAIYLLTDGQFTDKGRTVRYLERENFIQDDLGQRQVKVVFHTIGFYSRDGEEVLKEIARKYKGTYQFVAPPNAKNKR